jgi:hypothetical protein
MRSRLAALGGRIAGGVRNFVNRLRGRRGAPAAGGGGGGGEGS